MKEGKESGGMCKIDDIFSGVFKILFRQRGLAQQLSLIGPHISWRFLSSPSESDALVYRHVIVLKLSMYRFSL